MSLKKDQREVETPFDKLMRRGRNSLHGVWRAAVDAPNLAGSFLRNRNYRGRSKLTEKIAFPKKSTSIS